MTSDLHIRAQHDGYTAIYGSQLQNIVEQALLDHPSLSIAPNMTRHSLHVTLLLTEEAAKLTVFDRATTLFPDTVLQDLHFLGLGSSGTEFHIVVLCPAANAIRKKLGLPIKDFHVTVTGSGSISRDSHKLGYTSLLETLDLSSSSVPQQIAESTTLEALAKHLLLSSQMDLAHAAAIALCITGLEVTEINKSDPLDAETESNALLLFGNIAYQNKEYRLAMLCFAQSFDSFSAQDAKTTSAALRGLHSCSQFTELGPFATAEEISGELQGFTSKRFRARLFRPWSQELKLQVRKKSEAKMMEGGWDTSCRLVCSRGKCLSTEINGTCATLPRFFSWIIPFCLAGSSTPRNVDDCRYFAHIGITSVLTLTAEEPLPSSWLTAAGLEHTFLPIPNGASPQTSEFRIVMHLIQRVIESGGALLIHCGGGKGRAGTMLAAFVSAFGFSTASLRDWSYPQLGASQSIEAIRSLRPGSIETDAQEAGIRGWVNTLHTSGPFLPTALEPSDSEPNWEMSDRTSLARALDSISILIAVGLPGSGKSWLRKMICSRSPDRWVAVNGDEDGGSKVVETAVSNFEVTASQSSKKLFVDQCNVSVQARSKLQQLYRGAAKSVWVVFFDFPEELCSFRASMRPDHATLSPSSAAKIVSSFAKKLVVPTLKEGYGGIVSVNSREACRKLTELLAPIEIFKYPRTAHLLNLGSVGEDDITMPIEKLGDYCLPDERKASNPGRVLKMVNRPVIVSDSKVDLQPSSSTRKYLITEKIDGANVGFSLSSSLQVLAQNRSHWVSSDPQFRKLGGWIEAHRESLYKVLNRENQDFRERWILFGEWMCCVHSIHYTELPDLFIAFDLYDRMEQRFATRSTLTRILEGTSIQIVPLLHQLDSLPSELELREMVQQKSKYTQGPLEGVYVKVEDEIEVKARGKVVRPGFICGNEHWSKGIRTFNNLAMNAADNT